MTNTIMRYIPFFKENGGIHNQYTSLFIETVETDNDIKNIIHSFTEKDLIPLIFDKYTNRLGKNDFYRVVSDIENDSLSGDILAFYAKNSEVKNMLTKGLRKLFIKFSSPFKKGVRGAYSSKDKLLYVVIPSEITEALQKSFDNNESVTKEDISELFSISYGYGKIYYNIFQHELTHSFDDFRSKGKAMPYESIVSELDTSEAFNKYLLSKHEINARYAGQSQTLQGKLIPIQSQKEFIKYLDDFKSRMEGWNLLSKEEQERLIKRLYKDFTTLNKEEIISLFFKILTFSFDVKDAYDFRISNFKNQFKKFLQDYISGKYSNYIKNNPVIKDGIEMNEDVIQQIISYYL